MNDRLNLIQKSLATIDRHSVSADARAVRLPPASEKELAELASCIGQPLPEDFVALYKLQGGERGDAESVASFPLGLRQLSIPEIVDHLKRLDAFEPDPSDYDPEDASDPRLQPWASPGLKTAVPFAGAEGLDYHFFLDLDPGSEGAVGQVTYNATECDMEVLAPSLGDFLSRCAQLLDDGALTFDRDAGIVARDDMPLETAFAR